MSAAPPPPAAAPVTGSNSAAGSVFLGRHPRLRKLMLLAVDVLVLVAAPGLAYEVGFNFEPQRFSEVYHFQYLYMVGPLVLARLAMLWALGLYSGISRYAGFYELTRSVIACLIGTAGLVIFNILSNYIPHLGDYPMHPSGMHILRIPWGVVIIDALLAVMGVSWVRLGRRVLVETWGRWRPGTARRVLIVGAGAEGEQVARDLLRNHHPDYRPVAFVDPDRRLRDRRIHGIKVVGGLEDIERLTAAHDIQMVLIALPRPTPALLRSLVDHCRQARLEFKIIPALGQVMGGHVQISQMRPVEIEDLLGRAPVRMTADAATSGLGGRRVLVTGAGGSIGSELCRQALEHRPASLILVGRGENSLWDIEQELRPRAGALGVALEVAIGSVGDPTFVQPLLRRLCPQVIFHAAAHKHVHFMEAQPAEAVKNNITGTRVVAESALAAGVERLVLVSTDKAVQPRGVMGASKRVAEMLVSTLNAGSEGTGNPAGRTRFISVRFGNVLGSRGSIIPLFRRQIAEGGPVTITHPDATRYFMTIPEAVRLVIEAGAHGAGGEVFLLDMGQPIRILDLARQLITLSGLEPELDIPIQITGLRPGEKITEDLLTEQEAGEPTWHEKITRCPQPPQEPARLFAQIARLEALAAVNDAGAIRTLFQEMIVDYDPE